MFYPNAFRPDLKIMNLNIKTGSDSSTDDEVEFNSLLKLVRNQINKLNIVNFIIGSEVRH